MKNWEKVLSVGLVFIFLSLIASCNQNQDKKSPEQNPSIVTEGKLAKIFTPETIGTSIRWFESQYDQAKYVEGDRRTYDFDGCSVTVRGKESIDSLSLNNMSSNCNLDLKKMIIVGGVDTRSLPVYKMTFGKFEKQVGAGHYGADCLTMCGNAYDPSVWMEWEGPRAMGNLKITLEVVLVDDAAIDASFQWRDVMVAEQGEDWVIDTKFNDDHRYDNIARELFKNVPITSITIGRD